MSDPTHNALLNQLLVNLGRSLLQYVGEAWPWTSHDHTRERKTIEELVSRQQAQIARLVNWLAARDGAVEFGAFPTEYTDLHYVALDYLISQLIENETALIGDLEQTVQACSDDPEADELLKQILEEQRAIVQALQGLQQERAEQSGSPAA